MSLSIATRCCCVGIQYFLVNLIGPLSNAFLSVAVEHTLTPSPCQVLVENWIIHQFTYTLAQVSGIALFEDKTSISKDMGNFSAARTNHRDLTRHSFRERATELLDPIRACDGGQDVSIPLLYLSGDLASGNTWSNEHTVCDTQSHSLLFQGTFHRTMSDEDSTTVCR